MELAELVAAGAAPIEVAIAIARDHHTVSRAAVLREIDAIAAPLVGRRAKVAAVCRRIYEDFGFEGDENYDDPASNFIDEVVERRRGSPVALCVVQAAVCERAGVRWEAIAFPGHFLGSIDGVFVDPFDGRHPVERSALLHLGTDLLGSQRAAEKALVPVGVEVIAVRLLANLQRIFAQRREHTHSLITCHRLFELTGAAGLFADRGAHALACGAVHGAIADLSAYLDAYPAAADADAVRAVLDKARRLAPPPN
jgi:regulator of sirC expression with transglutaminase-like and TPR domain